MGYQKVLLFVLALCFSAQTVMAATDDTRSVDAFIRDDVYSDYLAFVAGRNVYQITSFEGYRMRRDVVDMVLALQALKLGGFNKSFNYQVGKVTLRNTNILERGKQLISFDTYWHTDAMKMSKHAYISSPTFDKGEYLAGVFAHPSNRKVFEIDKLDDFIN